LPFNLNTLTRCNKFVFECILLLPLDFSGARFDDLDQICTGISFGKIEFEFLLCKTTTINIQYIAKESAQVGDLYHNPGFICCVTDFRLI